MGRKVVGAQRKLVGLQTSLVRNAARLYMIMPQLPESCLNAVSMARRYAVLLFTWLSSSDPVGHKEEETPGRRGPSLLRLVLSTSSWFANNVVVE